MKNSKNILLTGFGPFAGETVNPSQCLLESVSAGEFSAFQVKILLLPVSYQKSFAVLQDHLQTNSYTDLLMLGLAGGRSKVGLERVALNWDDSAVPDEDGQILLEQKILEQAPSAYFTPYPLRTWLQEADSLKLPIEISHSAGPYVCNALSFKLANWARHNAASVNWLFVHFPYLPEQVIGKVPPVPSLEFSQMKKCLEFILQSVVGNSVQR